MGKIGAVSFEIEIVIATVAGLIMAVILYLNIRLLINRTFDVKRLNDTVAISEAISLYTIEKGYSPIEITTSENEVSDINGKCANACSDSVGCVNLLMSILPYLEIKNLTSLDGYSVQMGQGGMVTVKSCLSKTGETIEVTR